MTRRTSRNTPLAVANRVETGVRDLLARGATRRGWTPAVIAYPGYGTAGGARVLGRVLLAPPTVEPSSLRGIAGWRRLMTLEMSDVDVQVDLRTTTAQLTSGSAGLVDDLVSTDTPLPPGQVEVSFRLPGREPISAPVHVAAPTATTGVVCDIDDTAWITGLRHPLRAAWRTLTGSSSTRRSVPGMARLLSTAVEGIEHAPVVYLSNGPWNLLGPVSRFLERHHFPPGPLLMTDWGTSPERWFRDGRQHKASALERLARDFPDVRWILVGDDGEHDPEIYADFASTHPDQVEAILLRQVRPSGPASPAPAEGAGDLPVLRGADGDELRPQLEQHLRRDQAPPRRRPTPKGG
ncbi:App1 family protein [Auraticoccus monumenti]|uniref:Phosphatidate phosphatase APP1 n=1 Tax=Auraticoccus monumenti TaxID=675864 RepID=A0A1G6S8N3_9ACTN|nr:phosphatase domain-containing protein [Auraticoccus monumenti]SDD13248.1 Phosphatidate phosphatase APP1 [Auraticoccus monumenti]